MLRGGFSVLGVLTVVVLAGCGSSSPSSNTNNTPVAKASSSPTAVASAVPTSVDPCQVVTSQEASALTGAAYGAGTEETTQGGGKMCVYGAQTLNVFEAFVGVASSAAAAQSEWDQEKSQVEAALQKAVTVPGVTVTFNVSDTSISGADRAAVGTYSATYAGHTFSGSVLYLLKGAVFLAMSDLTVDHSAPSTAAMEAQAQTSLGRLP